MSLKAKLATTIAALCMVICLLTVGVWAANKATVGLKGTVSFTARDVSVSVSGVANATGASAGDRLKFSELEKATWSATEEPKAAVVWGSGDEGIDLTFTDKNEVITIEITVENNNTQRQVSVEFTPTLTPAEEEAIAIPETEGKVAGTNLIASYTRTDVAGKIAKATVNGETITAGKAVYTITLKIDDKNNEVKNVVLNGTMTISDVQA